MTNGPTKTILLAAACALAAGSACFGEGTANYADIQPVIERSCVKCHDAAKIDDTLAKIRALDNAKFDEKTFPTAWFPDDVAGKTAADFIKAADPPADKELDPKMAPRKAWILHEMNELAKLLSEQPPPDYTSQDKFDGFVKAGNAPAYEGCEMAKFLDEGDEGSPEGMAPLWGKQLLGMLGVEFTEVTKDDRQKLRDYLNGVLPGGTSACGEVSTEE
jgi:hypothetical protein